MKKTINQFFEEQKHLSLSKKSKELIYTKIYQTIKRSYWIRKIIFSLSKTVWVWVIAVLCLITSYYFLIWWLFGSWNIFQRWMQAKADYVWVVVSWNGSYTIELNNKPVDLIQSKNNIPEWGSLIVDKWSHVLVKTSNNTTANVVWPAKITFSKNKQSNELVVDVSYSQHIDIKKEKETISQLSTQPEEWLIIKTEQKTIVAKNETVDFSLQAQWDNQVVVNNTWNITISSDKDGSMVALQPNQKVILDAEVKLFALTTSDIYNESKKELLTGNKLQEVIQKKVVKNTQTQKDQSQISNNIFADERVFVDIQWSWVNWDNSSTGTSSISALLTFLDSPSSQNTTPKETSRKSLILSSSQSKEMLDEKNEFIRIKEEEIVDGFVDSLQESWSKIESNWESGSIGSLDLLLKDNLIIDNELLDLLQQLYSAHNKDLLIQDGLTLWVSSWTSEIIVKICKKLSLSCTPLDVEKGIQKNDYIRFVQTINSTIKNTYIITPDVKFISL